MHFFKPISANINYANYSLGWASHCLLPKILIFMIMYIHIFFALFTKATLKNAIKRSIIKQKDVSGKIYITNIFSFYIFKNKHEYNH